MHPALFEFMDRADMVGMGVGGQRNGVAALEQRGEGRPQRRHAHATIDQQVMVAAAQMPDVGPHQHVAMRFDDQAQPAAHVTADEPFGGHGQCGFGGHRRLSGWGSVGPFP
jgi:hypothetical protein